MAGATTRVEVVLADLPTPILPYIIGEPTREGRIELHKLVSGNAASASSDIVGSWNGHLTLTTTIEDYAAQTGFAFVPSHDLGDYLLTTRKSQDQALGIEKS